MRIALISDIHGNSIALDAVLADIEARGGVDAYWLLGDFSAMGHDPVGVLERVTKLPNAVFTRGWDWFANLPLEARMILPDGTRVLGVHAAPGLDDGPGIIPLLSDEELRALLKPAEADLVIVGHTHVPLDRTIAGMRVFNLGSVSNPLRDHLEASYAILETDEAGYALQLHYVAYDRKAVIEELHRIKHPAADSLAQILRGEIRPPWARIEHRYISLDI